MARGDVFDAVIGKLSAQDDVVGIAALKSSAEDSQVGVERWFEPSIARIVNLGGEGRNRGAFPGDRRHGARISSNPPALSIVQSALEQQK
jgi:hypothetical protein